jgi:hypothetical protein
MKFAPLVAVAATTVFVATGYAAAATIEILQVNNHLAGGSPAPPPGFTLPDLGTGTPNSLQTSSPFIVNGVTFSFSGGSGEFAGNSVSSSPFGASNATKNFVDCCGTDSNQIAPGFGVDSAPQHKQFVLDCSPGDINGPTATSGLNVNRGHNFGTGEAKFVPVSAI